MPEYQDKVKAVVDEHKKQDETLKASFAEGNISLQEAADAEVAAIAKLRSDLFAMHKQHSKDVKNRKPPPQITDA